MSSSIPGMWTDRLLSISLNLFHVLEGTRVAHLPRDLGREGHSPLNGVPAVPVDPKYKVGYGQWLVPGACIWPIQMIRRSICI